MLDTLYDIPDMDPATQIMEIDLTRMNQTVLHQPLRLPKPKSLRVCIYLRHTSLRHHLQSRL